MQFDVTTTAAASAGEIAAVQAYHTADGVAPCILGEFGPSTSGDANTTDANAAQVLNAVFNSGYGWAAWALNGTGKPGGDALSDDDATLNAWGQRVAQKIAAG